MMAIPRSSMSPLEHQQFQRLKVNRVAVIQELKVDHILHYLQSNSVLDDNDLDNIAKGRTTSEKSKRLLDILPTKGRSSNWYLHFRAALLNPSVDDSQVKLKYQILVNFLDNTIIEQMSHPVRVKSKRYTNDRKDVFPKYKPLPDIPNNASRPPTIATTGKKPTTNILTSEVLSTTNIKNPPSPVSSRLTKQVGSQDSSAKDSEMPEKWSMQQLSDTKIPHKIQYWDEDPEGFSSVLEIPLKDIELLERSSNQVELMFGDQERDAADRMRQLEIAYFLWKHQESGEDMVFCTCSAVLDIIQDVNSHHLYFKYFEHLLKEYDMEVALEIVYSYDEVTQWLAAVTDNKTCQQLVNIGFNMTSFLMELGNFALAHQTVSSIESFLSNRPEMWVLLFNFYVNCMALSNRAGEATMADRFHALASALREKISRAMSSFGQESLDSSEFFRQTSIMTMELGNFGSAYTWVQKAMQEVDLENKATVVKVLCTASVAYSNQWKLMRAEDLAVEAVQQARAMFGIYHPIYLMALQNFVSFSNQHRSDGFGVEASLAALNIAKRLYRYNSAQVAQAYAGHASALLAAKQYDRLQFFDSAEKANDIAIDLYPLHDILTTPHLPVFVSSILCRAKLSASEVERQELVVWAESITKQLIDITELHSDLNRHKMAVAHVLLAEVHIMSNRIQEAVDSYSVAIDKMSECTGGVKHGNIQRIKTKLAILAKDRGDVDQAKALLKAVIDNFDTAAYYIDWYNEAYEALISCCQGTESKEIVKEHRSKHMGWKWISEDNQRKITWVHLHSRPEGYDSFLEKFELWRSNVKKVRHHIEQQKQSIEAV